MTRFSDLEKIFIVLTIVGGGLILFIPIQYLFIAFLAFLVLAILLANPKACFYLVIVLSTYMSALATENQQMPFNQTDILIAVCFISVLCRILIKNQKVNLSTKIDGWIMVLLILYFISGITSLSHRGYQGFLRFGEVATLFYMTVYFIRIKQVSISKIIKIMLMVGVFQSIVAVFQSMTGIGATFQDNRGYLGYLGIGSSLVWHGQGTMEHFNCLGAFLSSLLLFFVPIYHYIVKNKKAGKIIIFILLMGIITTYSRNALICLVIGMLFFYFYKTKNKIKFSFILTAFSLFLLGAYNFLKNTSYTSTISPRNDVWGYSLDVIASNTHNLLFGTGLSSFSEAVSVYMANSFVYFHAHNLYLETLLEMGIIGLTLLVSFLIYNLITAYKNIRLRNKFLRVLSFSICIYIIAILALGGFDSTFDYFYTQVWLYLILGILYAKNQKLYTNNI